MLTIQWNDPHEFSADLEEAIDRTRPASKSISTHAFEVLFVCFIEYSMRTGLYTFFAIDAIFGVYYFDMFVPQNNDFSYHLFRTDINAFPAGFTVMGIYPHIPCRPFF
jgi:hypothetical protein